MTTIPVLPSNSTDREIANHIRHYFPNMGRHLYRLLEAFEAHDGLVAESDEYNDEAVSARKHEANCPHCGSKVEVVLPQSE